MEEQQGVDICLCHDIRWRAKYHFIMNRLHGRLQHANLKRIPRVICLCDIDNKGLNSSKLKDVRKVLAERWMAVSTENMKDAKAYFDHFIAEQDPCEEFHGFLKHFRDQLTVHKLLNDSKSSASKFLYVLQQLLQNNRCSILDPIATNPQTIKINKAVMVLPALREKDIGNFIGRKGSVLRRVASKGSKIDIKFNSGTKKVEAHVVCPESGMSALKEKLERESKRLRKKRDQHEVAVAKFERDRRERIREIQASGGANADDKEDDEDDLDDSDDLEDDYDDCYD